MRPRMTDQQGLYGSIEIGCAIVCESLGRVVESKVAQSMPWVDGDPATRLAEYSIISGDALWFTMCGITHSAARPTGCGGYAWP